MNDITPKEASEILSHYTDLGYGIVIEGEDTSKIKQALSLASKTLANGTPYNPSERPKGEWKTVEGYDGDEYYECSNCGEPWVLMAGAPKDNNMNFCPNCGADMRKGDIDG